MGILCSAYQIITLPAGYYYPAGKFFAIIQNTFLILYFLPYL
jgi:hypothetical protein